MDDNYRDFLANIINEPNENKINDTNPAATLTVKVDIDAKIYCDGDFLDLVEANVVKKIPIEIGQHLITIESENTEGVSEDREVDIKEVGKNYLLIVKGIQAKTSPEKEHKISDSTEELINHICSKKGLLALFHGAYVIEEDDEEPHFIFEPSEWDRQRPWDEEVVDRLLNDKSIVVFKVNSYSNLDQYGVRTMAKNVSINDPCEPIDCYVYILSLHTIREGLRCFVKSFDESVSLMKSFVENIDYYNSDKWINYECDTIPRSVGCILAAALAMCNKQEAEYYINHH